MLFFLSSCVRHPPLHCYASVKPDAISLELLLPPTPSSCCYRCCCTALIKIYGNYFIKLAYLGSWFDGTLPARLPVSRSAISQAPAAAQFPTVPVVVHLGLARHPEIQAKAESLAVLIVSVCVCVCGYVHLHIIRAALGPPSFSSSNDVITATYNATKSIDCSMNIYRTSMFEVEGEGN